MDSTLPAISAILPVRNEARHIRRTLVSLAAQDYPLGRVEFLFVDGMSEDDTRAILAGWMPGKLNVQILANPGRTVPIAMNTALRRTTGEWVVRLDGHSTYPSDYLRRCIDTARRTGADNVGGVVVATATSDALQATLVQAVTTHKFGVGNSGFRLNNPEGPSDTVPYGCFRREVFERLGWYDERLVRNQDYEFNRRLVRSGGTIWLNPRIEVHYCNQESVRGLLHQAFLTGQWNPWMWFAAPYTFAPRHAIPALFVLGILSAMAATLLLPWGWVILMVLGVSYIVAALTASLQQARRFGWSLLAFLPPLFFTYHCAYGAGILKGLFALLFGKSPVQRVPEPWPGAGQYRAWPPVKPDANEKDL